MRTSQGSPGQFVLVLVLCACTSAWADRLVITPSLMTTGVGIPTGPFILERRGDDGGAPTGTLSVPVTLTAGTGGEISPDGEPYGTWAVSRVVTLAASTNQSPPFFLRWQRPGSHTVTGTAGGTPVDPVQLTVTSMTLEDDLEVGTLVLTDVPTGKWLSKQEASGLSMTASTDAAHRGSYGIRLEDQNGAAGTGTQARLAIARALLDSQEFHLRFWTRIAPTLSDGQIYLAQVLWELGAPTLPASVIVRYPGQVFELHAAGTTGGTQFVTSTTPAVPGKWHLVELRMLDINSTTGTAQLWIDGQQAVQATNLNWSGKRVERIQMGQITVAGSVFTGLIDFDDVRASVEPQAGRLNFTGDITQAEEGACVPFTARLMTSDGLSAPAPYPVQLATATAGVPGTFHADAACTADPGAVQIPMGASESTFFFRPAAAGEALLTTGHTDFLTQVSGLTLNVSAAPQDPEDPSLGPMELHALRVGCGCGSTGAEGGIAMLLLLALSLGRTPRSQRVGPQVATRRGARP